VEQGRVQVAKSGSRGSDPGAANLSNSVDYTHAREIPSALSKCRHREIHFPSVSSTDSEDFTARNHAAFHASANTAMHTKIPSRRYLRTDGFFSD
jgi:hypothetical protein